MKISSILNLPVSNCQSRWQRLREKFSREKKKNELETRSGSEACTKSTFLLYDQMKFLDSFVKSRKTYTNFVPKGTYFPMEKKMRSIPQKSLVASNDTSRSSEMLKLSPSPPSSLSPSPLPLPQLPVSLSSASSSSSTPVSASVLQSSTLLSDNKLPSIKPFSTQVKKNKKENKENIKKNTEQTDEMEKSFINLSSIVSKSYAEKHKMDEEDFFSYTVACELRKKNEPKKTELKGKIMKILYEL